MGFGPGASRRRRRSHQRGPTRTVPPWLALAGGRQQVPVTFSPFLGADQGERRRRRRWKLSTADVDLLFVGVTALQVERLRSALRRDSVIAALFQHHPPVRRSRTLRLRPSSAGAAANASRVVRLGGPGSSFAGGPKKAPMEDLGGFRVEHELQSSAGSPLGTGRTNFLNEAAVARIISSIPRCAPSMPSHYLGRSAPANVLLRTGSEAVIGASSCRRGHPGQRLPGRCLARASCGGVRASRGAGIRALHRR